MPNGGSDNCRWCAFNRLRPEVYIVSGGLKASSEAYCLIRNVKITNPLWTYCANYHTGTDIPDGPIFSVGIEDHHRIPWNNKFRPKRWTSGTCSVCGKNFNAEGIEVPVSENEFRQFCGELHYLKWWKENNPDVKLMWDIRDECGEDFEE